MENQFVTYPIALELKELGFDEPCLGLYYGISLKEEPEFLFEIRSSQYSVKKGYVDGILAPLWQQAIDWFREKHNLDITPIPIYINRAIGSSEKCGYIIYMNTLRYEDEYKTYEETREQIILKAIELIKDKELKN